MFNSIPHQPKRLILAGAAVFLLGALWYLNTDQAPLFAPAEPTSSAISTDATPKQPTSLIPEKGTVEDALMLYRFLRYGMSFPPDMSPHKTDETVARWGMSLKQLEDKTPEEPFEVERAAYEFTTEMFKNRGNSCSAYAFGALGYAVPRETPRYNEIAGHDLGTSWHPTSWRDVYKWLVRYPGTFPEPTRYTRAIFSTGKKPDGTDVSDREYSVQLTEDIATLTLRNGGTSEIAERITEWFKVRVSPYTR